MRQYVISDPVVAEHIVFLLIKLFCGYHCVLAFHYHLLFKLASHLKFANLAGFFLSLL